MDILNTAASALAPVYSAEKKVVDKTFAFLHGALPGCIPVPKGIHETYIYFVENRDGYPYVGGHWISEHKNIIKKIDEGNYDYVFFTLKDMSHLGFLPIAAGPDNYTKIAGSSASEIQSLRAKGEYNYIASLRDIAWLKRRYETLGCTTGVYSKEQFDNLMFTYIEAGQHLRVGDAELAFQCVIDLALKFTKDMK